MDQAILVQLTQRYSELPEEIKNFLLGDSFLNEVERISHLVGLSSEESLKLENEVTLILLAVSPIDNFEDTLVSELGFNPGKAIHIARLAEEKLFAPVRNIIPESDRGNNPTISTFRTTEQPNNPTSSIPQTSLQKALHDLPNYSNIVTTPPGSSSTSAPAASKPIEEESPRRVTYNAMLDVPTPGSENPKNIPEEWGKKF